MRNWKWIRTCRYPAQDREFHRYDLGADGATATACVMPSPMELRRHGKRQRREWFALIDIDIPFPTKKAAQQLAEKILAVVEAESTR